MNSNDYYRSVSRGQVWYLIDNRPAGTFDGSIQGKNRPWLIVSNDKCNQHSPVITCVPLTTQSKPGYLPTHVEFNVGDKPQTILCEQVQTLSCNMFTHSGSHYLYQLSDRLMKQVDEALSIHLGLSLIFPNSDRFWQSLEKLIRVRVKQSVEDLKVESIDVAKIASLIDAQTSAAVKNEAAVFKPVDLPTIQTAEPVKREAPSESPKGWVPHKPAKQNKWTETKMREFLNDCDSLSMQDVMSKWSLSMKSVYITKSKFRKIIGETDGRSETKRDVQG